MYNEIVKIFKNRKVIAGNYWLDSLVDYCLVICFPIFLVFTDREFTTALFAVMKFLMFLALLNVALEYFDFKKAFITAIVASLWINSFF